MAVLSAACATHNPVAISTTRANCLAVLIRKSFLL
jgi:hypothetical protein